MSSVFSMSCEALQDLLDLPVEVLGIVGGYDGETFDVWVDIPGAPRRVYPLFEETENGFKFLKWASCANSYWDSYDSQQDAGDSGTEDRIRSA